MNKLLLILTASLFFAPSYLSATWYQHSFDTMGTRAHVEFFLPTDNSKKAKHLINRVINEMTRLDQSLSPYIETSELSQLNINGGDNSVKVSSELFDLLVSADNVSQLSKGAFDITYASVGYKYDYRQGIRPTKSDIESALPAINYNSIVLNKQNSTVSFTDDKVKIDLGGIAKGYAIKQCLQILASEGIKHALMSAGGDTTLLGDRLGRPWLVGIKHPRSDDKNAVHIPLTNESISTSGDYERYFIEEGVRYHHIINPETGDSARKVVSVSVIGDDATVVDALSTTVFVKGLQEGMTLINNLEGYEAVIIDNNQRLHFSLGLQQ